MTLFDKINEFYQQKNGEMPKLGLRKLPICYPQNQVFCFIYFFGPIFNLVHFIASNSKKN